MGQAFPPVYGESKFYENKKAKCLNEIKKLNEIIKVCDEEISKHKK